MSDKVKSLVNSKKFDELIDYISMLSDSGDAFNPESNNQWNAAMELALSYKFVSPVDRTYIDSAFECLLSCNNGDDLLVVHPEEGNILHILAEFGTDKALHNIDTFEAASLDIFRVLRGKDGKTVWQVACKSKNAEVIDFFVGEYADILSISNIGSIIKNNDVDGLRHLIETAAELYQRSPMEVGKSIQASYTLSNCSLDIASFAFQKGLMEFYPIAQTADGFIKKFLENHIPENGFSNSEEGKLTRLKIITTLSVLLDAMANRKIAPVDPAEVVLHHLVKLSGYSSVVEDEKKGHVIIDVLMTSGRAVEFDSPFNSAFFKGTLETNNNEKKIYSALFGYPLTLFAVLGTCHFKDENALIKSCLDEPLRKDQIHHEPDDDEDINLIFGGNDDDDDNGEEDKKEDSSKNQAWKVGDYLSPEDLKNFGGVEEEEEFFEEEDESVVEPHTLRDLIPFVSPFLTSNKKELLAKFV